MAVNIGPKIGIEGEAQYRKAINDIITQTKTLSSEMKKLTSEYAKDDKSLEGNRKKRETLTQMIKKQEQALKEQNAMLEQSVAKTGEVSTQTEKWKQVVNNTQTEINNLNNQLKELPSTLTLIGDRFQDAGKKMESLGKSMTQKVTLPIVAGFGASIKSAIDWESAFTGVMKTVDETATTSYDDIAKGIGEIARTTASTRNEIAGVSEVAGQLGIGADDIVEFTRTMVMLGDTTNLTAEEVAVSLARIINITGDSTDSVDQLGSVIVDLGNNLATSESEIVAMANNLASSGKLAGLTTAEIFALSASMSSVGIQAQAGGTAMTQTLTAIESEVANFTAGADSNLARISEIAGMSATEFAKAWEEKPITAIQSFIEGLGQLDEKGESATLVLDELGMSGIRQSNMLKSLALASDTLNSAIDISNNAYEQNTALNIEAEKRYQTMGAQLNQLKESFVELGVQIGEILMPYVQAFVEKGKDILAWIKGLSPETKSMMVTIAGVVAVIGPLLTVIGKAIAIIKPALAGIGTAMSGAFSGVGAFISGALAPIMALVGLIVIIIRNFDELKDHAIKTFQPIIDKVKELSEKIMTTLQPVIDFLMPILQNFGNMLASVWTSIETTVVSVIQNIMTYAGTLISSIIGILTGFIDVVVGIINGDWTMAWNGILLVWESIKEGFSGFVEFITTTFTSLMTGIFEILGTVLEFVGGFVVTMLEKGLEIVANIGTGIINGIALVISAISSVGTSIVLTIGTFLVDMIQKGKDIVSKIGEGISDAVGNLYESVKSIGENIVNGVWQGIQSMIGTFTNNVTGFFSGIVDSVKGSLGIKSPSRVFAQIGRYMGEGLEIGWQKSIAGFNPSKDIAMRVPSVDAIAGIGAFGNNYSFNPNITINGDYRERDGMNIAMSLDRWLGAQV